MLKTGLETGVSDSALHAKVRLSDGRECLLVDIGAYDNLAGSDVIIVPDLAALFSAFC